MKTLLLILCLGLGLGLWRQTRKTRYWRENAIAQGRKRVSGADRNVERQEINRKTAHQIFLLNSEVERLYDENIRLRNMNRNLLRQMDRRNAG